MNQAIGNAVLFNMIIAMVVILIALFLSSLAYTKAYKVKNRIVEEIEKERTYNTGVQEEVDKWLGSGETGQGIGYRVNKVGFNCGAYKDGKLVSTSQKYQYCVYEFTSCPSNKKSNECGTYYHVIAYMYLDLPGLDLLAIPVSSDTMTFTSINS